MAPWNGSIPNQTFGRTDGTRTGDATWTEAAAAPVNIEAPDHDVHDTDLKDGINACLKKDGGNTAAADIPMGGFKLTNVGSASARNQYIRFAEVQDNAGQYVATVGGTADVITLAPTIAITAYAAGQRFSFIAGGTNTGATTVNVSGVGAKSIVRNDGANTALSAGDITSGQIVDIEYDGTWFQLLSWNHGIGADLVAIEAISSTGILRRSAANTWAVDAGVTHLANTTADRLFGTSGAGASGLVTLSGLTLSSSQLSVDAASDSASGKIEIAIQSEMEAGSSTTLAVTPGRQHFHPGHPKAGGNFDGSGTPAFRSGDHGMGAITDEGTGQYVLALDTAFANTNFWLAAWGRSTGTRGLVVFADSDGDKTTSSIQVNTDLADGDNAPVDAPEVGVSIWGDYA